MGKSGVMTQTELDRLLDERIEMQAKVRAVRTEIERRYRDKIEAEIEFETRAIERNFAVQLVEAKERGATYAELVKVLGTGTASVMRKYVELGGGSVRTRTTGTQRLEKRAEDIGVKRVGENLFDWIVGATPDGLGGLAVPVTVQWKNGTPYAWPVDGADVVRLRDDYGIEREELFEKGAEIVAAFGLTEE